MARDIDPDLAAELTAEVLYPVLFFELATIDPAVFVRLWNGIGPATWDGKTWEGVGTFGKVATIEETSEVRATGRSFELAGVDPAILGQAMAELRQGLPVKLWLGCVNVARELIGTPLLIDNARLDVVQFDEDAETASIGITAESRLIDLERPRVMRFTSESQKLVDPDDLGFQYVAALQDKEVHWGTS